MHFLGALVLLLARWKGLPSVQIGVGRQLNVFHRLFDINEPLGLGVSVLVLASAVGALFWCSSLVRVSSRWMGRRGIWCLALGAVLVTWAGSHWVYQDFPLSMDEYGAEMQATIFSAGSVRAPVPEQWRPFAEAMTPIFVTYSAEGSWISFYLPVYSLLRAGTVWLHPRFLLNPLLIGFCVLLVASIARRLLPDTREAGFLAALFLATSSQVLVNGMSFYSMPAHLLFNLLWLWFYLRDDKWGWVAVVVLGVLAMGLHQFVMHILFAAPFLFRLVRRRRWMLSGLVATAYGAGLLAWVFWIRSSRSGTSASDMASSWGLPLGPSQSLDLVMSWVQVTTWQAPVVTVLAVVAVLRIQALRPEMKDVLLSCLLTTFLYVFFLKNQGHGWGYRYFFPVLGNLALLSVVGWAFLSARIERGKLMTFVLVGALGATTLQLPMRALQVRSFVRPFAKAHGYLASRDADVVIIDAVGSWYGSDLVRNDPLFKEGPVIMNSNELTSSQVRVLTKHHRVEMVSPNVLGQFGLIPTSPRPGDLMWLDSPSTPGEGSLP